MAAIITNIITSRNFELIRDRIGQILAVEIANQSTLQTNTAINAEVYNERIVPFDKTDLPAINVSFAMGDYSAKYANKTDGIFTYNIDVYAKAKTKVNELGDVVSTSNLHKVIGIIQYVLSDARYNTLLFAPPSLSNTMVQSIKIADNKTDEQDATSMTMGRLIFNVNCNDFIVLKDAINLENSITSVKLAETNKGYKWEV